MDGSVRVGGTVGVWVGVGGWAGGWVGWAGGWLGGGLLSEAWRLQDLRYISGPNRVR